MGISKGGLALLYELKSTENLRGSICQLGRQHTFLTSKDLEETASRFGFKAPVNPNEGAILDDQITFGTIGFETIHSVDYSAREHPTYVLDLNLPIPEELKNSYDAVYDGGTIEHVFDIPQTLKNIHGLLKPGGLVIHSSPSHNHVDHGFYMFSPTLFHDWYTANGYEIVRSCLFEYEKNHNNRPWTIYEYSPGAIDHLSFGGWGNKLLGIWFVARKRTDSSCDVIPQQGAYRKAWTQTDMPIPAPSGKIIERMKKLVKHNPLVHSVAVRIFRRSHAQKPKVMARY